MGGIIWHDDPGIKSGVVNIFSTGSAFAALMSDGSVKTWGYFWNGDKGSIPDPGIASGVVNIFSLCGAFAALMPILQLSYIIAQTHRNVIIVRIAPFVM